jgi:hypothetical protein
MRSLVLSGLALRAKPEGCDLTVHIRRFDMRHRINSDPENFLSQHSKQLKLLETLIDKTIKRLENKKTKTKVQ